MALYQHLSGVTEEKEARSQSGEWKFELDILRTHAFIVTTTGDMSASDDDDENDDVGVTKYEGLSVMQANQEDFFFKT